MYMRLYGLSVLCGAVYLYFFVTFLSTRFYGAQEIAGAMIVWKKVGEKGGSEKLSFE